MTKTISLEQMLSTFSYPRGVLQLTLPQKPAKGALYWNPKLELFNTDENDPALRTIQVFHKANDLIVRLPASPHIVGRNFKFSADGIMSLIPRLARQIQRDKKLANNITKLKSYSKNKKLHRSA